eukprot:252298-Prymnesium_polylepis.1
MPNILTMFSGLQANAMNLHPCAFTCGLRNDRVSALRFKAWLIRLLSGWEFVNMVTAHNGNRLGDAHVAVRALLDDSESALQGHAHKFRDVAPVEPEPRWGGCVNALFANNKEAIEFECG